MAAKQGTLAQLSQAGEDAKRAVLSRTGVTSSWFSNLNTVCTIKSAPPRSPEVLQLLATKSGWLFKRNEQHVWQGRWCCAVPHTFLYYFDANIVPSSGTGAPPMLQPTPQQQEDWNRAISNGYGNRKQHEKRGNFYLFNHNNNASSGNDAGNASSSNLPPNIAAVSYNNAETDDNLQNNFKEADFPNSNFSANMQPAGIIDLECYTSIHRSSANANILELAGDDQVNPDLRSFYFCASSPTECEDWTDALLNGRHSSLLDECDAYKQVCEGFAQQLQMLHNDIDEMKKSQDDSNAELYRARCQMEEMRRTVRRLVEDCFDRTLNSPVLRTDSDTDFHDEWKSDVDGVRLDVLDDNLIQAKRLEFTRSLETIHSQDMGVPALVRLLIEYSAFLEDSTIQVITEKQSLHRKLEQNGQSDQQRAKHLELELESLKNQKETEINQYERTIEALQAKYQQSQKELEDVQNDLSTTRMEVTMYQTQQRTKLAELQQHKKILKKEVIELRSANEAKDAVIRKVEIQNETNKMAIEQEMVKTSLLERYVAKIESQVNVQQNMMEMMSHSGMGSVYGGSVYAHNVPSPLPPPPPPNPRSVHVGRDDHTRKGIRNSPSSSESVHDNERNDDNNRNSDEDQTAHIAHPVEHAQKSAIKPLVSSSRKNSTPRGISHSSQKRRSKLHSPQRRHQQHLLVDDIDNKSHVSELTEDRTQRHFDAYNQYSQAVIQQVPSPRAFDGNQSGFKSSRMGPPIHIIGVTKATKNSHSVSNEDDDGAREFDDDDNCDHRKSLDQNAQTKSTLDTINSSSKSSSLPLIGNTGAPFTPSRIREIPRGSNGTVTSISSSKASSSKMSVSQRARQDADSSTGSFRIVVDDKTKSMLLKQHGLHSSTPLKLVAVRQDEVHHLQSPTSTTGSHLVSTAQSQHSQSLPSGLWRRVEEAVLGSSSDDDTDSLESNDGIESIDSKEINGYSRSIKNTDESQPNSPTNSIESGKRKLEKIPSEPVRQVRTKTLSVPYEIMINSLFLSLVNIARKITTAKEEAVELPS